MIYLKSFSKINGPRKGIGFDKRYTDVFPRFCCMSLIATLGYRNMISESTFENDTQNQSSQLSSIMAEARHHVSRLLPEETNYRHDFLSVSTVPFGS